MIIIVKTVIRIVTPMTIPTISGRVGVAPPTVTGVGSTVGVEVMITVLLEVDSTVGVEVMIMVLLELDGVDDLAVNTNHHKNIIIIRSSIRLTYLRDESFW